MKAKFLVYALLALILATIHLAEAQQPKKIPRIGYLFPGLRCGRRLISKRSAKGCETWATLREKTLSLSTSWAEGKVDRLPHLAAELVRAKVDVIYTASGGPSVLAIKKATKTIPIVFGSGSRYRWRTGLVDSLAKPGGNATG